MLPTHALWGMVLAVPLALAAPELAGVGFLAGLFGGILPDFDLYVGHRRTLHYPVYFPALAAIALPLAIALPRTVTVAAAFFLLGAAVHSLADILGGGLELRPWEGTSERAVYDHHRERWIAPRRWVRYDGAPEDLLLSAVLAVPLLVVLDGPLRFVVLAALLVATVYTAVRRTLPAIAVALAGSPVFRTLPDSALERVPSRYVESGTDGSERSRTLAADDR